MEFLDFCSFLRLVDFLFGNGTEEADSLVQFCALEAGKLIPQIYIFFQKGSSYVHRRWDRPTLCSLDEHFYIARNASQVHLKIFRP